MANGDEVDEAQLVFTDIPVDPTKQLALYCLVYSPIKENCRLQLVVRDKPKVICQ